MKVGLGAVAFTLLVATVAAGPGLAAEDEIAIDCGKTDLAFAGDQFDVKCSEFREQIHQGDGSAQVQIKLLMADSTRAPDWLVAFDSRLLGSLAIRRIGMEENVATYFDKLPIKNWKSVDDIQGFEAAEFVSEDRGEVQDCVAFQRFFNRRYNGFSRWVVGVSCSSDGREIAYKTLAGFSGPGD